MHFSVRLPIYDPAVFQSKESLPHEDPDSSGASTAQASSPKLALSFSQKHHISCKASEGELNANWEMWDVVRTICDNNVRLTLSER
jgi:protein arginine N-methyltransferase 5